MCLRASWRALRKKRRRRLVARWTPHRNDAVTRERRKSGHSEGMEGLVRKRVCSLLLSRKSEIARESRTRAREVGRQENRLIARSKWQSSALNFKTIRLTEENLNSWCRRGDSNPLFFSTVFIGFYAAFSKPRIFPKKLKRFAFYTSSTTYTTRTYLRLS